MASIINLKTTTFLQNPFHPKNTRQVIVQAHHKALFYDLHTVQVPYEEAWQWQKRLVHIIHDASHQQNSDIVGAVLLLQHPPVYTLGSGSTKDNLNFDPEQPPYPLFRTERGGEVTYHGPGQLVMYPIIDLQRFKPDLHWYLRCLEQVIITALNEVSGLQGERIPGLTGVWVDDKKVAAIGVRATKWVTYHGLALNVTADLAPFSNIVPCGIADKQVTSVRELLHLPTDLIAPLDVDSNVDVDGSEGGNYSSRLRLGKELLNEYRYALAGAFEEVLEVELQVIKQEEAIKQLSELG